MSCGVAKITSDRQPTRKQRWLRGSLSWGLGLLLGLACSTTLLAADPEDQAIRDVMRKAATYYRTHVATRGGYVYHYSLDLKSRWGEGPATASQIWVQVPGTPAVGMAYLDAFEATSDSYFLDAAREAGSALLYGQLKSGGWTNSVDFDPKGSWAAEYRNDKSRGRNYSTLDDGITQHALRFLMRLDRLTQFSDPELHAATKVAHEALLAAQFPSGGFPQVWNGPVKAHPIVSAKMPDYDWRTENRIKEYWNLPTLNDDLASTVAQTLVDATAWQPDPRNLTALTRLGDFLLRAQLPEPQPGWAQQYDLEMRPAWARKFEPPAVSGRESQDAIRALLLIARVTGDQKYVASVPRALDYLKSLQLPDGQLARFYELTTNRPLYMTRDYKLTYDDRDVPTHYGWKTASKLEELQAELKSGPRPRGRTGRAEVERICSALDEQGRWVSTFEKESLTGQPKFQPGDKYLSSKVFAYNLSKLSGRIQK